MSDVGNHVCIPAAGRQILHVDTIHGEQSRERSRESGQRYKWEP